MSKRTAQITQENIAKIRLMEAEKDSMIVDLQEQVLTLSHEVKDGKAAEKRLQEKQKESKEARREQRELEKDFNRQIVEYQDKVEELAMEN